MGVHSEISPRLLGLHDSTLTDVANVLGLAAKLALRATCRELYINSSTPGSGYWRAADVDCVDASLVLQYLKSSRGGVELLSTKNGDREPEQVDHVNYARFISGLRYCDAPPYTLGHAATALATLLPNLQELCIDERTCCLGGMTDDFAKAVAEYCPRLSRLEVRYAKGPVARLAAERFSDDGLSAIAERCTNLKVLVLCRCSGVTDRALYALAANCQGLTELRISGYNEQFSDAGVGMLLASSATTLVTCHLSSKLTRVTDAAVFALLHPFDHQQALRSPHRTPTADASTSGLSGLGGLGVQPVAAPRLKSLKLSRDTTDEVLWALAGQRGGGSVSPTPALAELHLPKCQGITAEAMIAFGMSGACPQLSKVRLPDCLGRDLGSLMSACAASHAQGGVTFTVQRFHHRKEALLHVKPV